MAHFSVRDTLEIPEQNQFALVGTITDGEIHPDMFIRCPLSDTHGMNLMIDKVETGWGDLKEVYLGIRAGPNFINIIRDLKLRGRTFRVEEKGYDE